MQVSRTTSNVTKSLRETLLFVPISNVCSIDREKFTTIDKINPPGNKTEGWKNLNKIKEDPAAFCRLMRKSNKVGCGRSAANRRSTASLRFLWEFGSVGTTRERRCGFPSSHELSRQSRNENVVCPNNSRISDATSCRLLSLCLVILQFLLLFSATPLPSWYVLHTRLIFTLWIVGSLIRRLILRLLDSHSFHHEASFQGCSREKNAI